ncbi:YsnF/AvaK domain-containing protein [Archangium violaceum]|nr:YsnF/AvaK domain-containing protein [Archangium violaceum]
MIQRSQLKEGMTVRSSDGEKLGKVFALGDEAFHIEKGIFFPKDYLVRYEEISDIRDGEIILTHGREGLLRLTDQDRYGAASMATSSGLGTSAAGMGLGTSAATMGLGAGAETIGVGTETRQSAASTERRSDEVAVPVHKEELDVSKRDVQSGEVRIHKEVVEEVKTVSVPVRRERVSVERRDVNPDRPAMNASFQDETVVVPLHAEEVELHKRPVVSEEVVIRKDEIEEERRVAEPLRHEEVDVRTSGEEDTRSLNLNPDDPTLRRS